MIVHAIAVLVLLPLITLRGRTLRFYFALDLATYALAWIGWRQVTGVDPRLAAIAFVVAKLVLFFTVQATAAEAGPERSREVRWSASRAAIQALLVYSLVVPQNLRVPIDGDEPFFLLLTESIVHDRDVDLANQYRALQQSAARRTDLGPQFGDPTGSGGEQYSRHQPLLPMLMVPGYLMAGLPGAIATIVLFGALLVRSTMRMFEDEGIDEKTARAVFPLFAFGPPILFYATRIWVEVPAAFFFVEAIRGIRGRRTQRWVPALLMMVLLKLRFALVAAGLGLRMIRSKRNAAITIALIAAAVVAGSAFNVHTLRDLALGGPRDYLRGFLGLILDGSAGITFQAPFHLLGLFAVLRWRQTPEAFRLGLIASSIYLLLLVPRTEWYGGWGPPLRYITFLMPVLALGAASIWNRLPRPAIAVIVVWTAGVVVHGVTYPWRLFHIANGESVLGEGLSRMFESDFSRLIPSFIRENEAATIATVVLVVVFGGAAVSAALRRGDRGAPNVLIIPALSLALAFAFVNGQKPGRVVEFEDAHVTHEGGALHPDQYAFARFAYRGGWVLQAGDSVSFLAQGGDATLEYATGIAATVEMAGTKYALATTPGRYGTVRVHIPQNGRVMLRCTSGSVNLDRLVHD